MIESAAYIPGFFPAHPAPLARFLPPLADGVVKVWLKDRIPQGSWLIDPFGASPRHTVEAARLGYRVLTAVNNPIARFLIELYASPPTSQMLQSALAELAFDPRTGEKLEQQIRSFYLTQCESCGQTIEAQAFIWEKERSVPVGKLYSCPHCKDSGEHLAGQQDIERAQQSAAGALHRSRALERVVSLNDPDRIFVEEALEVYTPRALSALQKMVNRLERMSPEKRRLASALLLGAFDQANSLWHYPPARARPRQLSLPNRYLERNIWRLLEEGAVSLPLSLNGLESGNLPIECTEWPVLPVGSAGICIYPGHLKDLAVQIKSAPPTGDEIQAVLGIMPRYNQAFWTLSTLWAGWLWGKLSIADFRSVLRRRRYDWGWHLQALHAALGSLTPHLKPGIPALGLIGEAEPLFVSSSLLSAGLSGFNLDGIALRASQGLAQIHWKLASITDRRHVRDKDPEMVVSHAIASCMAQRGEPVGYSILHAAALQACISAGFCTPSQPGPVQDLVHLVDQAVDQALREADAFVQFSSSERVDTGQWWLNDQLEASLSLRPPLSDRVELTVLRKLLESSPLSVDEIDAEVCSELRGLLTPDRELIVECVQSYGQQLSPMSSRWQLRPQDDPLIRRRDLLEISEQLTELGKRLGFRVPSEASAAQDLLHPRVEWLRPQGEQSYTFHLTSTGALGEILFTTKLKTGTEADGIRQVVVLPGGRAGLVEWKLQQNPRLRREASLGWSIVKFRHIRWMAENESLKRSNLAEILRLDPLANQDPQMPLL